MTDPLIQPNQLIDQKGVDELNRNADAYYHQISDHVFQIGKPFTMPTEASRHLIRLGLILENFAIGPGSRVLDFGAGTCWISRYLWQMGCHVCAVDVSEEALRMGKTLFQEYPLPKPDWGSWNLRHFDGHHLPVEDGSIDRILCYDTFHHVPNPERILEEWSRVLVDGGLIALNEPIGQHSETAASQREMRDYGVLENDLQLDQLLDQFHSFGFQNPLIKTVPDTGFTMTVEQREHFLHSGHLQSLQESMQNFLSANGILIFSKGEFISDSRQNKGLNHQLKVTPTRIKAKANHPVSFHVEMRNTGSARWIHGAPGQPGSVAIGTQQIDPESGKLEQEHQRFAIGRNIEPGENHAQSLEFTLEHPGNYTIRLDLVSEHVCWFQDLGAEPVILEIEVG